MQPMICVICQRKLNAGANLQTWVTNGQGALVKVPRNKRGNEAFLCADYLNQINVCRNALNDSRMYLSTEEKKQHMERENDQLSS